MPTNRRTSVRHDVDLPVNLEVGDEQFDARIENLSLGGAFVSLGKPLCVGQRVELSFAIPGAETIRTAALVRWSDDRGMGVQFGGLRAGQIWALNEFLKRLLG